MREGTTVGRTVGGGVTDVEIVEIIDSSYNGQNVSSQWYFFLEGGHFGCQAFCARCMVIMCKKTTPRKGITGYLGNPHRYNYEEHSYMLPG